MGKKDKNSGPSIRSPICVLLAHVDHGKTSILDKIRGTAVARGEAGGITQAIGASIIPLDTIKKMCGDLLKSMNMKFTIPGMLFIDSPGHEAFSNLRKRGGNLADIAILVVDINDGLKPQTIESIEILKQYKTPFIVALNKIDMISGWHSKQGPILANINSQQERVKTEFETKLYEIVGKLYELGFNADRFDRVSDYTKQIGLIPTSAMTGEGIPELVMVLSGLAQRYLEQCLECNVSGPAKGTILEVKETKGLGKTMDVIIYDGTLKVNDQVIIGTMGEPIQTKVRAMFQPQNQGELRDKKTKFMPVKEVAAATGVKLAAPNIDEVIAGMPIVSLHGEAEKVVDEIKSEVEEVLVQTEDEGILIKADTLGSLEALSKILSSKGISVRKASVGNVSKKDLFDAESSLESDPINAVVLGFNIEAEKDLPQSKVKILTNTIIYKLIEDYEDWVKEENERLIQEKLSKYTRPAKFKVMRGYIFRQSNPAVCGCDILMGKIKTGMGVMNKDGKHISSVKAIQLEKDTLSEAEAGKQVAVSLDKVSVGRQINEDDILYSAISADDFRAFKENSKYLTQDEKELLKEIAEIKRQNNPVWGV